MILDEIRIHDVRNISEAKLEFGKHLNILFGENGSGKSSVLESIYLLSSGKSFRSTQITKIIQENKKKLTLFGKISGSGTSTTLGLEKSRSGHIIHINSEKINRISELAKCLPVLVVTQDSHKLLEAGPQWRRQFVDWGLFHVKHEFHAIWGNYRKLLKNRNLALSQQASIAEIDAWNEGLASYGETYSELRTEYIKSLSPYFENFATELLGKGDYELQYKRGWSLDISLLSCLQNNYERDRFSGRTEFGPHRADFILLVDQRDAKDHVSRGQQKLLVYALNLAQIAYIKQLSEKETLLLLDDLGSELDLEHSEKLLSLISSHFSQVCITTANIESLPLGKFKNIKMFHVKHGTIESVS